MEFTVLKEADAGQVTDLFGACFQQDHYYMQLFPDPASRRAEMARAFAPAVSFCLRQGCCMGLREEGALVAFLLCFDYRKVLREDEDTFRMIFTGSFQPGELPYSDSLHGTIRQLPGEVLYLLSVAVDPRFRRMGLASGLVDAALRAYPDHYLVSDVSNDRSLDIYRRRNFTVRPLDEGYHLIIHAPRTPFHTFSLDGPVKLALPSADMLTAAGIPFSPTGGHVLLCGFETGEAYGVSYFTEKKDGAARGMVVTLAYGDYLAYQRLINLSLYGERAAGDCVFFVQRAPYACRPLMNGTLEEMVRTRRREWSLVPDVYVSIPMEYSSLRRLLDGRAADERTDALLGDLNFRTHYEAGIPNQEDRTDDQAGFKRRITRYGLGKLTIKIAAEMTAENFDGVGCAVGPPAAVDLYISVDRESSCAVLTWYSLSCPFLISHLFDNIIQNQIIVVEGGAEQNLFTYLNSRFGLRKRGTPKIFSVVARDRSCLDDSQLASLLASETIYEEGQSFGRIIDADILSVVQREQGMGQYDRSIVYAYSNVVFQFSPDFRATLRDRLGEESITLFYMELVLFEEAAISIANGEITRLLAPGPMTEPVEFLRRAEAIYDNFSRTIEFWNIQVNYPTSQQSVDMLRGAFRIEQKLEAMRRSLDQLQLVFATKSDIIDRRESRRMDSSLAILSVLAILSAWIDGHDYIATWSDVFPPMVILVLQRLLFLVVLLVAGYAVTHLLGRRSRRREKKKDDKKGEP